MTLNELRSSLELDDVCVFDGSREFCGVYAGDLLSRAMSHVKLDNVWITIMPNTNVIAVASLTEAACVILAEGVELLPEALDAARENEINVFSSPLTVYELCVRIADATSAT